MSASVCANCAIVVTQRSCARLERDGDVVVCVAISSPLICVSCN
jgi:hypothetical protein